MEINIFETNKGKRAIGFAGFKYREQRIEAKTNRIAWRCTDKKCKGAINTDSKLQDPRIKSDHNHLPDVSNFEKAQMISNLRNRSVKETAPISLLYREESMKLAERTSGSVNAPPYVSIHSGVYLNGRTLAKSSIIN